MKIKWVCRCGERIIIGNICRNCGYKRKLPVSRYKTIKGWAGKAADGSWCFAEPTYGVLKYPAELRIKVKYLKGGK